MNNSTTTILEWEFGRCDFSTNQSRFDLFLFLTIAITALAGNIIVFVCYSRFRSLRSTTNVFLLSLSASDLLVAVIQVPYTFGVYLCHVRPPVDTGAPADLVYIICDMLTSIASIYSLTLIAVDKAIAVTHPFSHKKYVNEKLAVITVAVMWIFVVCITLLVLVLDRMHFTLFIIFMSYVIPVIIMVASYALMGYVAKKHAKAINQWERTSFRLHGDTNGAAVRTSGEVHLFNEEEDCEKNKDRWLAKHRAKFLWREFKAAATLLLLLTVFVVAWTPFMSLNIKLYICPECHIDSNLAKYFKTFHYSNSALNPILYILLSKRWRCAFRMVLCYPKRSTSVSEETVTEMAEW